MTRSAIVVAENKYCQAINRQSENPAERTLQVCTFVACAFVMFILMQVPRLFCQRLKYPRLC